jgi:hypothetical protein
MGAKKGWIGVDLDGTLADHYWPHKGPYNPLRIGDPLAPMVVVVQALLNEGYEIRIFTARVGPHGSAPGYGPEYLFEVQEAIRQWTRQHVGVALESTCIKDYHMAVLYDDRCRQVAFNTGLLT